MTTNFTLRDFFVYLLSGLTLIICLVTIFLDEIIRWTVAFFDKYVFITGFAFLVTIFLIPVIYLIGQFIGSLSFNLLKLYIWLDNGYFKRPISKLKFSLLMVIQKLLYRQRVAYAVNKYIKKDALVKQFRNIDDFWYACAKLQVVRIYGPAEYWYVLNELFNSLNLIFFFSTIISFCYDHWILGIIYTLLTIIAFRRARQYADHFIQTVCNLTKARHETKFSN
jgi:hypothetical protein